jgi:Beta-propeller repeat
VKLNPQGAALVYGTYLGGTGSDVGLGIAIDTSGNAYVTGGTFSADFPVTIGVSQLVLGGDR